jgi:hypothetical protein
MWHLLWQVPLFLVAAETVLRIFAFFLLPWLGWRLRTTIEHQIVAARLTFHAFTMCGCAVMETPVFPKERWSRAALLLEKNVSFLTRDSFGYSRYPFVVTPGNPSHVKVVVEETADDDSVEALEGKGKDVMTSQFNTRWPDSGTSPLSVTVIGGKTRVVVVFAADHVVLDGVSVIELARRYLLLLQDQDPGEPVLSLMAQSEDSLWFLPFSVRFGLGVFEMYRETRGFSLKSHPLGRQEGSDDAIDLSSALPFGKDYTVVAYDTLSCAETDEVLLRARQHKVTVGNVVTVAFMKALDKMTEKKHDRKDYSCLTLVDLRRLRSVSKIYSFGLNSNVLNVSQESKSVRQSSIYESATYLRQYMKDMYPTPSRLLLGAYAWQFLIFPAFDKIMRSVAKEFISDGHNDLWLHGTCSNLGAVAHPIDQSRHRPSTPALICNEDYRLIPRIVSFFGGSSATTPTGGPMVFAISSEGRMCLTATAARTGWSQKKLQQFLGNMCELLREEE